MTEATAITPIPHSSPYPASEAQALAAEVAKCLKLVAPSNMNAETQTVWLHAAVDALEDIRASEVSAISAELRRSVTRPAQIVPEIAKLVAEKRQRASRPAFVNTGGLLPHQLEREVEMRRKSAHTLPEIEAAWKWEREARIAAGQSVRPIEPPLSRAELDRLPAQIRNLGLARGLLEYRGGELAETA